MASALPAFDSHGGRVEAFDDGHCPETFRCENEGAGASGDDAAAPRIVRYDLGTSADVHVYDGVLDERTSHMLYEATAPRRSVQGAADMDQSAVPLKLEGESPWGTYVTLQEALERMEHATQSSDEKKEEIPHDNEVNCNDMDNIRHALAVEAVAKFFLQTVPSTPGTAAVARASSDQPSNSALYERAQFLEHAHGVAVWALSSSPGESVQYHIDYAELLRYEYNVTVPPLWAGTIQCSALWNESASNDQARQKIMKGGEFCVNPRGLDHYAEHGYKGNLSGDPMGGWRRPEGTDRGVRINGDSQWVTIPYAFNRGIVHCGDLPHLSAPVDSINGLEKSSLSSTSRVIVGFNVFGHDVGECVAKAPEHSRAFRRKVKLYRATTVKGAGKKGRGGMDISQIRKNKGLTKLLVLAKREKVKEELRRNQQQLSDRIWQRLLSNHRQGLPLLRVADLVAEFGSTNDSVDGTWPKSDDVHVHLNQMLRSAECNALQDGDGGAVYCMKATVAQGSGLVSLSTELDIVECTSKT
ncbi:hypothetical protein ACHAXT_000580 [Thalassiosira profunda]